MERSNSENSPTTELVIQKFQVLNERPLKNVQFCSSSRQFRRIAELDSRQDACKGEGHGRPESTRRF